MLRTVESIIEALGGTSAVAELSGVGLSAVSNWKKRGRIPSEKFLMFKEALAMRGDEADPVLFGFETAEVRA